MVGTPDFPGRAIVVIAAGNSAGLYGEARFTVPRLPLRRSHREVHVPRRRFDKSLVPLVTPAPLSGGTQVNATAYVWIGFRDGDDVTVGLDDKDGSWVPQVKVGQATTFKRTNYEATIFNGTQNTGASTSFSPGRNGAVLILDVDLGLLAATSRSTSKATGPPSFGCRARVLISTLEIETLGARYFPSCA